MPGVALAHELNVNLVRKWFVGLGLKRAGLPAPRTVTHWQPIPTKTSATAPHFLPVRMAADSTPADAPPCVRGRRAAAGPCVAHPHCIAPRQREAAVIGTV